MLSRLRTSAALASLVWVSSVALFACGDSSGDGGDDRFSDDVGSDGNTSDSSTTAETGETGSTGDTTDATGDTATGDTATGDTATGDTATGDTTSTTGDTTDTTDATDSTTDIPCQEFSSQVAPIPPDVMFLLDRSGSMTEVGFDLLDPNKTRWQALYESVEAVVDEGADEIIGFGAKTFSTKGQGSCGVSPNPDVPIALNNAALLLATIPQPMELVNGGTPTNLALETTMTYMQSYQTDADKFVILITDGRFGCVANNDDAQALADAVAVIETARVDHNIITYVVGIAPSVFGPNIEQLNGMAIAGGAPTGIPGQEYFLANDAQMLATALAQVVEDSYGKSCLLNLAEPPFFPEYTKVQIGAESWGLVNDCETEDGFIYVDDTLTQIKLCGAACVALGLTPMDAEVQYYCNPG